MLSRCCLVHIDVCKRQFLLTRRTIRFWVCCCCSDLVDFIASNKCTHWSNTQNLNAQRHFMLLPTFFLLSFFPRPSLLLVWFVHFANIILWLANPKKETRAHHFSLALLSRNFVYLLNRFQILSLDRYSFIASLFTLTSFISLCFYSLFSVCLLTESSSHWTILLLLLCVVAFVFVCNLKWGEKNNREFHANYHRLRLLQRIFVCFVYVKRIHIVDCWKSFSIV